VGILDAGHHQRQFFRGNWATFGEFIAVGFEHILLGPDHLLFLLTVIIAGVSWRYWAGVVTSFTLAHSITLSLAVFGVVRVDPKIVEPAIAASILLMAVGNLYHRGRAGRARIGLVFACGLLHGLGFASALGDIGLDPGHRVSTLAGFNIGVELGQFTFILAMIGVAALARRLSRDLFDRYWVQGISVAAAGAGGVMLLARIYPILPSVQ
jgi:hydrogenase/urease accessory protein HupE